VGLLAEHLCGRSCGARGGMARGFYALPPLTTMFSCTAPAAVVPLLCFALQVANDAFPSVPRYSSVCTALGAARQQPPPPAHSGEAVMAITWQVCVGACVCWGVNPWGHLLL